MVKGDVHVRFTDTFMTGLRGGLIDASLKTVRENIPCISKIHSWQFSLPVCALLLRRIRSLSTMTWRELLALVLISFARFYSPTFFGWPVLPRRSSLLRPRPVSRSFSQPCLLNQNSSQIFYGLPFKIKILKREVSRSITSRPTSRSMVSNPSTQLSQVAAWTFSTKPFAAALQTVMQA